MLLPRRSKGEKAPEPEETSESDVAERVLAHAARPEDRLEQLLAERSRELEEQAARFEQAMDDLERREEQLRDMRLSVERLLRLGTTELTEREGELAALDREAREREARLSAEEEDLVRRRSELGAVELKREALEQRERAVAAREAELAENEAADAERHAPQPHPAADGGSAVGLLFVPGSAYRLVEIDGRRLDAGDPVEVDGETFVVARVGPPPLPGDRRRCAYLERGASGSAGPGGSS